MIHPRGVSMPIAIGMVLLLMTASVAINQAVIRNLRSVNQIEASTRAYAAAEAGIEDALYELSAHFAGFEIPSVFTDFQTGTGPDWNNNWTIKSRDLPKNCPPDIDPETVAQCGRINAQRKAVLSFFNDEGTEIQTLDVLAFSLTFKVPQSIADSPDNAGAFSERLVIDNDADAWVTLKDNGINEDGDTMTGDCLSGPGGRRAVTSSDADCDGKEDEDSAEDPLIYWKLSDGAGAALTPKQGCAGETDPDKPLGGSEICEKNMIWDGEKVFFTLDETFMGVREDGSEQRLVDFFENYDEDDTNNAPLQMELLVVAPLEQVDLDGQRKIPLPYLEYTLNFLAEDDTALPAPYFLIESDGVYRDFQQSITTTLTPRTSVPLLDFTLIQQQ